MSPSESHPRMGFSMRPRCVPSRSTVVSSTSTLVTAGIRPAKRVVLAGPSRTTQPDPYTTVYVPGPAVDMPLRLTARPGDDRWETLDGVRQLTATQVRTCRQDKHPVRRGRTRAVPSPQVISDALHNDPPASTNLHQARHQPPGTPLAGRTPKSTLRLRREGATQKGRNRSAARS